MNIRETMMHGEPLVTIPVVDAHCHIGPWFAQSIPNHDITGLCRDMDRLGIDRALVSAMLAIGPDFRAGNRMVAELVARYPERFTGYVSINPNFPEAIEAELATYYNVAGMKAIKIHPTFHRCALTDEKYRAVFEFAELRGAVVLSHTWGIEHIRAFDRIAALYPHGRFILGHSGGELDAVELAMQIVAKHDNLYLDLAVSLQYEGIVELFCNRVGAEHVLFGTDAPLLDPRYEIGRIVYADISEADKEKILGLNIKRLIEGI
jgi:predicted TIM-barrel fold metal-dependent hydrolase